MVVLLDGAGGEAGEVLSGVRRRYFVDIQSLKIFEGMRV